MKKLLPLLLLVATPLVAGAQIGNVLENAKKKAEEKARKELEKKEADKPPAEEGAGESEPAAPAGKTGGVKAYSKFDFVPGERVLVVEDFMQDAVGDFPDKWNTNASAEVVTLEGIEGHWLMLNRQGVFMPEFIDSLPADFTLEFDLLCDNPGQAYALYTSIVALTDHDKPALWQPAAERFTFTVVPGRPGSSHSATERRKNGEAESSPNASTKQFSDPAAPVHVAVWRQKERVRVYFNEEKVWDLPKAIVADGKFNALVWWLQGPSDVANYYLSNLRLAIGAPDTRNKLLTEGRWVTHGILFDVNSANIKPASYGTMKEVANVLKEDAAVRVTIIGHTDADGDEAANLDLSRRRAAAVKEFLVREFAIDGGRLETDGLGESKPTAPNTTPEGKANNRRVEFVKI
ncbi:MAG: OmpA family protein [Flavobacteriales bacterium]|nr:OmpA family protein [Flavobacteriales bacterium]